MKEALITIRLRDVVTGTSTNADALPLFNAIDVILSNNQKVRL